MQLTDWKAMTIAEPLLAALEADVEAFAETTRVRDEWDLELVWCKAFKPRLEALVGWHSLRGCLQSAEAYHVAYDRLYGRLMAVTAGAR